MVQQNFHHRARRAIQILASVYLGLTVLEVISLILCGMSFFDAITHSFATIATGGFSTKNDSIAFYNNPAIEIVIIIFMTLSGIHFVLLFSAVTEKINLLWRSTILRFYIIFLVLGVLFSTFDLYILHNKGLITSLRYAAFNIISVGTSTGFATTDTSLWPSFSQLLIISFFNLLLNKLRIIILLLLYLRIRLLKNCILGAKAQWH